MSDFVWENGDFALGVSLKSTCHHYIHPIIRFTYHEGIN